MNAKNVTEKAKVGVKQVEKKLGQPPRPNTRSSHCPPGFPEKVAQRESLSEAARRKGQKNAVVKRPAQE